MTKDGHFPLNLPKKMFVKNSLIYKAKAYASITSKDSGKFLGSVKPNISPKKWKKWKKINAEKFFSVWTG
jgi:hypothetical protein